ncbi:hypothetical protein GMSM_46220 [Geomonas sp. Red276]
MKRIGLTLLLLISTQAHAAIFDVNHFNGVRWGSAMPAKGFRLILDAKDGWKFYSRPQDHSRVEGIPVSELTYKATRGKFDAAHFIFNGDSNYTRVKALMVKTFGPVKETRAGREIYRKEQAGKIITGMLQYSHGQGLANFYRAHQ